MGARRREMGLRGENEKENENENDFNGKPRRLSAGRG
jgi:hypothetical protein